MNNLNYRYIYLKYIAHVVVLVILSYCVYCDDQVQSQFDGLHSAWISFQQCLIDSDAMLKKHKVRN